MIDLVFIGASLATYAVVCGLFAWLDRHDLHLIEDDPQDDLEAIWALPARDKERS